MKYNTPCMYCMVWYGTVWYVRPVYAGLYAFYAMQCNAKAITVSLPKATSENCPTKASASSTPAPYQSNIRGQRSAVKLYKIPLFYPMGKRGTSTFTVLTVYTCTLPESTFEGTNTRKAGNASMVTDKLASQRLLLLLLFLFFPRLLCLSRLSCLSSLLRH